MYGSSVASLKVYKSHWHPDNDLLFSQPAVLAALNRKRQGAGEPVLRTPRDVKTARRDHEYEMWNLANRYGVATDVRRVTIDGEPYLEAGHAGFSIDSVVRALNDRRGTGQIDDREYRRSVAFVVSEAIDALKKLQDARIVHRDAHALNLTLAKDPLTGQVKAMAIDFEYAKIRGTPESALQATLGSYTDFAANDKYKPHWAEEPRESVLNSNVSYADHKSDLFYFLTSLRGIVRTDDPLVDAMLRGMLVNQDNGSRDQMMSAADYGPAEKNLSLTSSRALAKPIVVAELDTMYQQLQDTVLRSAVIGQ